MKANFPTNHNYYGESPLKNDTGIKDTDDTNITDKFRQLSEKKITQKQLNDIKKLFNNGFELTTKSESLQQLPIFRFKPSQNKLEDDEEQLIIKLYKKADGEEAQYIVQTGLFAGVVYHGGCEFNITCRYGEVFLHRMLNFLNDIYVDSDAKAAEKSPQENTFKHILAHLFIHSLERSATLGFPKLYQKTTQRSHKVRGSIDINAYLRQDIPFQGKLTTKFNEQQTVQEIIDVLYLAAKKLADNLGKDCLKPINHLYQSLKTDYSGRYTTQSTINQAKQHRVLASPLFASFRQTLEYADIILNNFDLCVRKKENREIYGYLFDISQLFEIYLEKLISRHFDDWVVTGQEKISVYESRFYRRNMYPDMVMRHTETGKVIVLDAKFKQMNFTYRNVERSDFYQIHSYMSYYGENLLFGGLLYPLSKNPELENIQSQLWGIKANQPSFIIDGIRLWDEISLEEIHRSEQDFLQRIEQLIEKTSDRDGDVAKLPLI